MSLLTKRQKQRFEHFITETTWEQAYRTVDTMLEFDDDFRTHCHEQFYDRRLDRITALKQCPSNFELKVHDESEARCKDSIKTTWINEYYKDSNVVPQQKHYGVHINGSGEIDQIFICGVHDGVPWRDTRNIFRVRTPVSIKFANEFLDYFDHFIEKIYNLWKNKLLVDILQKRKLFEFWRKYLDIMCKQEATPFIITVNFKEYCYPCRDVELAEFTCQYCDHNLYKTYRIDEVNIEQVFQYFCN